MQKKPAERYAITHSGFWSFKKMLYAKKLTKMSFRLSEDPTMNAKSAGFVVEAADLLLQWIGKGRWFFATE